MKALNPILMSGREVIPVIEGGKGISITNGESSGAWAACGGVGTFSGVNADAFDRDGNLIPQIYRGRTRRERHEELVEYAISGALYQARVAHESSGSRGRIHMNVLWEMGAAERILLGILESARELIHGVTCGAGMPYRLAEIAARYGVHYYPIISSARAFRALWKRAYHKFGEVMGAVVYEDPWLAGGHNGLSNNEDPQRPEDPFPRVLALRRMMNSFGLRRTPIIMAGGVWYLREWEDWIDNDELGPMAFQFGTRPLLTQESPISDAWKRRLLTLKRGDVFLNRFSPTGFWSSAVNNGFIKELRQRNERQIAYTGEAVGEHGTPFPGRRAQARGLCHRRRRRARQGLAGPGIHGGAEDARLDPDLRDTRKGRRDTARPDRVHGVPEPVQVLQLGPERQRLDRPQGGPAQLLHPENPPGHLPLGAPRGQSHVRRDTGPTALRPIPSIPTAFIPTVKQLFGRILTGD